MTDRRKAELQRKLSMAPLPKPPAGLAERIKRDIPHDLRGATDADRARFTMFSTLSLRVAASILVLIGGAYFAIRLLSEIDERAKVATVAAPAPQASPARDALAVEKQKPVQVAEQAPAMSDERKDVVAAKKEEVRRREPARIVASNNRVEKLNDAVEHGLEGGAVGGVSAGIEGGVVAQNEPQTKSAPTSTMAIVDRAQASEVAAQTAVVAARAPSPAALPAPAPPPPAAADMAKTAATTEAITISGQAPIVAPAPELFGISTDRQAFDRIKFAIEHGDRPVASTVDVAALVNYFAGGPVRIRHEAALDLEASSRPVRDGNATALVRVSVDTSETIYDATLEIAFDPRAVVAYHRIGGESIASATEPVVQANRSVTALYAVDLRQNVRTFQNVATATLTYRSANGRQILTQRVTYAEAQGAWTHRSRRHRLATLGAIWGETLRASAAGTDVAQKAEELSKQEPRDEKAKELATLATASSRLRSSSPTGSGR